MSVTINAKGTSVSTFTVGRDGTVITQSGTISPPAASDLIIGLDEDQSLVVDAGNAAPALITTSAGQDLHINPAVGGGQYLLLNATRWPTTAGGNGQTLVSNGSGILSWQTVTGTGTVTSLDISGGTTGLTTSGGPITTSGTITLAGTLSVSNGGTGLTSTPSAGQIDIGNGTGFTRTTITAGNGITVTNGSGTISISSTAGAPTIVIVSGTSQSATADNHYILTNTGAATTVTLPASPADGEILWIMNATARTDHIIANNGNLLQGVSENMTINVADINIQLRYINATIGWRML